MNDAELSPGAMLVSRAITTCACARAGMRQDAEDQAEQLLAAVYAVDGDPGVVYTTSELSEAMLAFHCTSQWPVVLQLAQILLKFETALPVNAVTAALAACEQVASEQGDATQIALAPDLLLVLLLEEVRLDAQLLRQLLKLFQKAVTYSGTVCQEDDD